MTAAELIAELQKLPPDTPVVIRDYEGDVVPVDEVLVEDRWVYVQATNKRTLIPTALISS